VGSLLSTLCWSRCADILYVLQHILQSIFSLAARRQQV
jgi:hypothetical protein